MVDARDTADKLKSRWRTKFLSKEDTAPKKAASKAINDDDVNDFLKPSTDKAQAHKEAAAAAFLAAAKPRIDVSKAQRWPGASDVLSSSAGRTTPCIGGMKSGQRKRGLTVNFARTQPDIIGEGGDECEEPAIEVSRRRRAHTSPPSPGQMHQDDIHVGAQSFNPSNSVHNEAERRGIVTRTLTHGELSPPLQQKMEMGRINTHANPPPLPARGLGSMGLGERPRQLQRTPTGFDMTQDAAQSRPSLDSTYSYESENLSPVTSRKAPSLAPTQEEEDDFRPKPLQRTATGWSEHQRDSDDDPPPPLPGARPVPGRPLRDDSSSLESNSDSHSTQVKHRMRADEGRALHALHEAAARRAAEASMGESASSTDSVPPTAQSRPFQVGTPPSQFTMPLAGRTPPRLRSQESPPRKASPQKSADSDYAPFQFDTPGRSPPRGRHMPPGTAPLDTKARPQSGSSSHYTLPSAASRTRGSPSRPSMEGSTSFSRAQVAHGMSPASVSSQPAAYSQQAEVLSANSQTSILPTPPQFERQEYIALPPPETNASRAPAPDARTQPPRRDTVNEPPPQARKEPDRAKTLSRSDTKSQGEEAFFDFADRVQHMQGIFALTAQVPGQLYDHTPRKWLRVATWWFLKGRTGMESLIRSRPKDGGPQPERLTQPHVDLAKCWWIVTEIIPNHPGLRKYGDQKMESQARLARDAGDSPSAEAYELYDALMFSLKMLLGSMKRHQSMPPTQALIQGQDQSIWVEYPKFALDAQSVLAGSFSKSQQHLNPAILIPVGDTKTSFCYFRMFANASVPTDDPNTDRIPFQAVISVLRSKDTYQLKLSICSQSELVNVVIGPNPEDGPTWRDVSWKPQSCAINIQLRHGFNLNLALTEQDFRSLRAIFDHTTRVEHNLRERADERFVAKMYLRDCSYVDPANPGVFPPGRIPGCKLMVFHKFERSIEGTGRRKLHRGYRLVVVTNTKNRTLSCVNHEMGTNQEPMEFGYLADSDKAPGMTLKFREVTPDGRKKICNMTMFFNDPKERNHLFGTFTSMNQQQNEAVFAHVPLKSFTIESADQAEGFSQSGRDVLKRLQWVEAKALNLDPEATGLEAAPTVLSESLRIVCRHSAGVISDRMNLGPGDLLVRLPTDGAPELTLLRNPQQDMAVAIDSSRAENGVPEALAELLRTLTTASTIRRLTFNSYKDLHEFQLAVTGFQVIFDGIASTFQISRRRMVVPIYKQWTANTIRIQVVSQDNIIQLLAFFEDFSHADAMNFQLKSMDVFEKTDKNGKACVRLVDAKFALPVEERRGEGKMGKEEGRISGWAGMKRRFVCLDQIEYPGEHDDILIAFDAAETRDRFAEALPAAAQVGRKFTVRRKI